MKCGVPQNWFLMAAGLSELATYPERPLTILQQQATPFIITG